MGFPDFKRAIAVLNKRLIHLLTHSIVNRWRLNQERDLRSRSPISIHHSKLPQQGFTLLEVLVVLIIVGILSAITAPSWLAFSNNQKLIASQTLAISSLRQAQSNAKREQVSWQASFRNLSDRSQYAIHRTPILNQTNVDYWNNLPWSNFDSGVRIVESTESQPRTTFTKLSAIPDPDVYRVQFTPKGLPNGLGEMGRITLAVGSSPRRLCVIISTILGAMRTAESSDCNQ
jgi:prepilin-type N-terminal cleavage/methylation domain-containing protein